MTYSIDSTDLFPTMPADQDASISHYDPTAEEYLLEGPKRYN